MNILFSSPLKIYFNKQKDTYYKASAFLYLHTLFICSEYPLT